jgi:2-oxoglutarate ferredoxin oxidoreductase subunit alpha
MAICGPSPGNVLMQEPFGMAEAMRLPLLAVIQQRGVPWQTTPVTILLFPGH